MCSIWILMCFQSEDSIVELYFVKPDHKLESTEDLMLARNVETAIATSGITRDLPSLNVQEVFTQVRSWPSYMWRNMLKVSECITKWHRTFEAYGHFAFTYISSHLKMVEKMDDFWYTKPWYFKGHLCCLRKYSHKVRKRYIYSDFKTNLINLENSTFCLMLKCYVNYFFPSNFYLSLRMFFFLDMTWTLGLYVTWNLTNFNSSLARQLNNMADHGFPGKKTFQWFQTNICQHIT